MLNKIFKILLLALVFIGLLAATPLQKGGALNKTTAYNKPFVKFNRITLPIFDAGQIGNIVATSMRYVGQVDTMSFLYSSGFFLSGFNQNGELWVNGVQPSLKVLDYVNGTVENPIDSIGVYYNSVNSKHFGKDWQNWKDAVALGAEFYDGDKDGIYTPVDKNGNGIWDENEDRPALYGDVMVWSAFNDGVPASQRRNKDASPQGINIRQTIWGYENNPNLEKVVFIKYSIENSGTSSPILNSVNFSLATNPDLGYSRNDFLASDSLNNSVLIYTPYKDYYLNDNQIALSTTMIQGPLTDSPQGGYYLDGENLTQKFVQSQNNANLISSVIVNSYNISYNSKFLQKMMLGEYNFDPCTLGGGMVNNADCNTIDNKFVYSGNPITLNGWTNSSGNDKAFLMTTGSFNLEANKPVEIIFAFVLGVGEEPIDAMKEAIQNGQEIKYNFFDVPEAFPEISQTTITDNESIELLWESDYSDISQRGYGYSLDFKGYNIYMYNSPSTSEYVNNQPNKKLIATYQMPSNVDIKNVLIEDKNDYTTRVIMNEGIPIHTNNNLNRILHKVSWDPFINEPLRKGKPYYFSITSFGFDYSKFVKYDFDGTYLIPANAMFGYFENSPLIINDDKGNVGIVIGENQNDSYFRGIFAEHKEGISDAKISYSIYEQNDVTDDLYEIGFRRLPKEETYSLEYVLTNISKGIELNSVILNDDYFGDINDMQDGFVLNIDWIDPGRVKSSFTGEEKWFKEFDEINTGVFYVGSDIKESQKVFPISLKQSRAITIEELSTVELRFAETSKALRYVRTLVRYPWKGSDNIDSGFVDIPVSAYKIDKNGNEIKLQLGFLENGFPLDSIKIPDGKWNPSTSIADTKEYLVIFNTPYTGDISKLIAQTGTKSKVADIANGYMLNPTAPEITDSIITLARSPWFNAMYVVGFSTPFYQPDFNPTGKLTITPSLMLTENDKYYFRVKKEKTLDDKKAQFDKINVYPNPLFAYNSSSSAFGYANDEPFVTFSNLPEKVDIKIYSLSGSLIKSFSKNDLSALLRWDLKNEYGNRIASGLYIAIIDVPDLGQRILKFSIIQAQKNVHY